MSKGLTGEDALSLEAMVRANASESGDAGVVGEQAVRVIDHYRSLLREADSVLSGVLNMHIAHHNARQHAAARALLSRIDEALGNDNVEAD